MKPVFKCDYCQFMGTEEEVKKHEPECIDNYDKQSCYTCQYRGRLSMVDSLLKYECSNGIDVPAGKVYEFCKSYQRKEKTGNPYADFMAGLFKR